MLYSSCFFPPFFFWQKFSPSAAPQSTPTSLPAAQAGRGSGSLGNEKPRSQRVSPIKLKRTAVLHGPAFRAKGSGTEPHPTATPQPQHTHLWFTCPATGRGVQTHEAAPCRSSYGWPQELRAQRGISPKLGGVTQSFSPQPTARQPGITRGHSAHRCFCREHLLVGQSGFQE